MQAGTRVRAQARRERASQGMECKPRAESRVAGAHDGGSREAERASEKVFNWVPSLRRSAWV